jgi:hypothetical protein
VSKDHTEPTQAGVRFEFRGQMKVKGKQQEIRVFSPHFQDQADSLGKPDAFMWGRRREYDAIMTRVRALHDTTAGGVVMVEGEAGMGKTRLIQEVIGNLPTTLTTTPAPTSTPAVATTGGNGLSSSPAAVRSGSISRQTGIARTSVIPVRPDTSSQPPLARTLSRDSPPLATTGGNIISPNNATVASNALLTVPTTNVGGTPSAVPSSSGGNPSPPPASPPPPMGIIINGRSSPDVGGSIGDGSPTTPVTPVTPVETKGERRGLRYKFGIANSMTSKSPYGIWRGIVAALLSENSADVERAERRKSLLGNHTGIPGDSSERKRSNGSEDNNDDKDGHQSDRSSSHTERGVREAAALLGGEDDGIITERKLMHGDLDDDEVELSVIRDAGHDPQAWREEIAHQLRVCGLPEDEYALMNIFTNVHFKESPKTRAFSKADRARRINTIIVHLLKLNLHKLGPYMLVLENIQWLDSFSWSVLSHLCCKVDMGVLLILTMRYYSLEYYHQSIISLTYLCLINFLLF